MKRYSDIIKESIESEKALRKYASKIMEVMASKIQIQLTQKPIDPDNVFFVIGFDTVHFTNVVLKDFIKFCKGGSITMRSHRGGDRDFGGWYNSAHKEIELFFNNLEIPAIAKWDAKTKKQQIFNLINGHVNTLTHELTHMYDDFISSGKYNPKNYKIYDPEKGVVDEYLKQNIEVNARYNDLVTSTMMEEYRIMYDWKTYNETFIEYFSGWKALDKEQQKKLIKRLWLKYNEPFNQSDKKYKYLVLNDASYKAFNEVLDNPKTINFNSINKHRFKPLQADLIKYMKETIQLVLTKKYNKKEIKEPSVVRNRYAGLRSLDYNFDIINSLKKNINRYKIENNWDVVNTMQKQLQNYYDEFEHFAKYFDLTMDEVLQIADTMHSIK